MSRNWQIGRRTFLRGVGTAMALPLLEAMRPWTALGAENAPAGPRRMAFVYVPNGVHMPDWRPATVGPDFDLPPILEPLEPFKKELLVLSGLAQAKARANGDGGGDHARGVATFLTGVQARKTAGKDLRVGVSVDQLAALKIGNQTRFPSLEIGCEQGPLAGNCDSGYSCAYSATISWRTESTPIPKEINPRAVFDRLFANKSATESALAISKRLVYQQSVLDFVREDAARLQRKLGQTDRRKIDEYLSSVRELEQRVHHAQQDRTPIKPVEGVSRPAGVPDDYREHLRLMGDLLALAFQLDLTRISTFMFANAASNRDYRLIGVPDGHHDISHHGDDRRKQEQISKINRFHMEQFAYLIQKLKAIPEGEGTLLDNVMIVYGSGISDGNRHNHEDLPILLVGGGGGTLSPGRHLSFPPETPLMNLYLSMLDRMGVEVASVGDSTGRLEELSV